MPLDCTSEAGRKAVREQLDRILKSGTFQRSQRRQRFLEYVVDETLAGRGDRIKGYNLALEVFKRPATFDANVDPMVRIEAGRLRDRLREYYEAEGQGDPVRIELPKGSYTPKIEFRRAERPASEAEPAGGTRPDLPRASVQALIESANERQAEESAPLDGDDGMRDEPNSGSWRPAFLNSGWMRSAVLAASMLLIIAAGFSWMNRRNAGPALPDKPSIAVLPFDNIGRDARWDRFAEGMTEDIITDLAQTKDLIVIARNSTEVYKDKPADIRQVGRDLNVKYVLEGSIQAIGERIRVTAQLIEAASGSHVWSERYDRPADDLFAVQNDVTQRIAATLVGYEGAVAEAERSLLRRKPPANLTAFDTYLLGMEAKHKVTKEGLFEAEGLFRKSIELDPQLARAYCGLATVQLYLIDLGLAPSVDEALSKMMEASVKAVQLDPNDGLTHLALGGAYAYHGKTEQALAEFDRAESLAPSNADLLLIIGWSLPQFGQSARAVSLAERALTLNPHYPDWYNQGLSVVFFFGKQFDRSVKYRSLVKEPLALDYAYLAMSYAYEGRTGDAEVSAANVMKLDPAWNAERYLGESGGYAEEESELFVDGARKAGLPDCVPADKLKDLPNLIHVKSCDQKRAKIAG